MGTARSVAGGVLAAFVAVQALLVAVVAAPAHAIGAAPDPPTFVESEQVDDGVLGVIWDAPTNVGDSPVTSYTATASPTGFACTTTETPPQDHCFVSGLTVGVPYTFTVVATNAAGNSVASSPSPAVTVMPFVVPGAPAMNYIYDSPYDGVDTADVYWHAGTNAGPPLIGYTATASPGGQRCSSFGSTGCSLTGLSGDSYSVTVVAVNAAGASAPSAADTPLRFRLPNIPGDVRAGGPRSTSASVYWSGGPTYFGVHSSYVVTSSPGGLTCHLAAPTGTNVSTDWCIVEGLTPSTSYTFVVVATNANGTATSMPSAVFTTAVQPAGPPPTIIKPPRPDTSPPSQVSQLSITGQLAGDGTAGARLAWAGPDDMTSVRVGVTTGPGAPTSTQSSPGVTVTLTRTSAVASGLRPGMTYLFAVYPVDAAGNVGRSRTARVAGLTVRTKAVAAATAGQIVPVTFSLRDLGGRAVAGKPVHILVRAAGATSWHVYRRATTSALGGVTVSPRLASSTQFALRFAGERDRVALAASGIATVRVASRVSASLRVGSVNGLHMATRGQRAMLSGSVAPTKRTLPVYLQKLVGKTWRSVAVVRLGNTSTFAFVLPTGSRGTASYRVYRPADASNVSGVSTTQLLTVA